MAFGAHALARVHVLEKRAVFSFAIIRTRGAGDSHFTHYIRTEHMANGRTRSVNVHIVHMQHMQIDEQTPLASAHACLVNSIYDTYTFQQRHCPSVDFIGSARAPMPAHKSDKVRAHTTPT